MDKPANDARMRSCPSFDNCSAPICPLDEFSGKRSKGRGEPGCVATKPTRYNLGSDLKNHGFTPLEKNSILRFYPSLEAYFLKSYVGSVNNSKEE